jgi:hypothetical protein
MEKHAGFIYVMSNMAFKDNVYKIGRSQNPKRRMEELSNPSGTPMPFDIEFSVYAYDVIELEKSVHEDLAEYRINDSREFFACNISKIVQSIMYHSQFLEGFLVCDHMDACRFSDCNWYEDYEKSDVEFYEIASALQHLNFDEVMVGVQRYRDGVAAYKNNKNVVQIK